MWVGVTKGWVLLINIVCLENNIAIYSECRGGRYTVTDTHM